MDEYLAKKNINILGVTPDGRATSTGNHILYIVLFEYQWRRKGHPVWSKDFIRVAVDDNYNLDVIRKFVIERVLELRKELEAED